MPLPRLENNVIRLCRQCDKPYDAGTYRQHVEWAGHPYVHWDTQTPRPYPERDAAIVAALNDDPYLTLDEVGKQYGMTRERVRQIYKRDSGQASAKRRPRRPGRGDPTVCPTCGETYLIGSADEHYAAAGHGPGEKYERNREIERLYVEDGLSSVQIGRIYGIQATQVVTMLTRRGVKMKPKGRKGDRFVRETMVDAARD